MSPSPPHRLARFLVIALLCATTGGCTNNPGPPKQHDDAGAPDVARDRDADDRDTDPGLDPSPGTGVAVGQEHSCVLVDGEVWCWGQSFLESDSPLHVPARLDGVSDVVQVDAEFLSTCAVTREGDVWCWDGSPRAPAPIEGLEPAVMVATGGLHGCALHATGEISCWGHDFELQESDPDLPRLDPVVAFVEEIEDATMVAAGNTHTCALHEDATVSCWGYDSEGQLGDGPEVEGESAPRGVRLSLEDVVLIEAGHSGTCAVHRDGGVSCWGRASRGSDPTRPARVDALEEIVDIAVGPYRACALDAAGRVSCWEFRSEDNPRGTEPVRVDSLESVVAVETDGAHVCARTQDGEVACWGSNAYGQLGLPAPQPVDGPTLVEGLTDVRHVVPGHCALRESGEVWCWGGLASAAPVPEVDNVTVLAGDADNRRTCALRENGEMICWFGSSELRPVMPLPDDSIADAIGVGHGQRCAVYGGGNVACWGEGADVVDGYIEDAFRPRPVEGIEDAVDVSVGDEFACARRQNGAVSCWGRNEEGQLGIGASGDPVGVATEVGELAGADQIALGPRHGCALVDGEVLCWGNNRSSTPTTVEGLTDVTAIGAGGHVDVDAFSGVTYTCRTCAVAGGEVWCWGREILGEDRQRVDGLDDPVELAVGAEGRDCALGADGRVLCWGEGFTRPDGVDWHDEPVVVEVPPDDSGE